MRDDSAVVWVGSLCQTTAFLFRLHPNCAINNEMYKVTLAALLKIYRSFHPSQYCFCKTCSLYQYFFYLPLSVSRQLQVVLASRLPMLSPSGSETSFVFLENSPKPSRSASYAQPDPQVPDKVRIHVTIQCPCPMLTFFIRSTPLCCHHIYPAQLVHTHMIGLELEQEEK